MKQKSLRQSAKELGVSHSYLSQVKNGKRPASDKVVSTLCQGGKQNSDPLSIDFCASGQYNYTHAEVAQVVEQRTENPRVSGSTPLLGTNRVIPHESVILMEIGAEVVQR